MKVLGTALYKCSRNGSNEIMQEIACLNERIGSQSIGVDKAGLPAFMKKTKQLPSVRTK